MGSRIRFVGAALGLCVLPFVVQAQGGSPLKLEAHVFQSQSGEKVDAELGRLTVPESRTKPGGKTIEVAFVRFKSTAAQPGPPIVYLAGGPGGSGIDAARSSTRFPLFMAMRAIADVIAYDQRGTGQSTPMLRCSQTLDYPLDQPGARAKFIALVREKSRACAQEWQGQGVDLAAYNTNESADDLEDLRKALGAKKISLWGISYGTHLGLTAIRRHEASIHQAILAGIEGPAHTLKLPSNTQRHLEQAAALAKADANTAVLTPDLVGLVRSVLEQLEKKPLEIDSTDPRNGAPFRVTVGKLDLQIATGGMLGNTPLVNLPALYAALSRGDLAQPVVQNFARQVAGQRIGGIGLAMSFAMDCASGTSPARLKQIAAEEKQTILGAILDFPFPDVCEAWGVPDLGEAFRAPVRSKVPVLFISGTLDARTPVSNADEVRKGFANNTHLIVEGAVHSDPLFLASPKILETMLEFLKGRPVESARVVAPFQFRGLQPARTN